MTEVGWCGNIIREASYFDDKFERIAWIGAFFLTVFGSFNKRVNKPFNPMLGETFEFQG